MSDELICNEDYELDDIQAFGDWTPISKDDFDNDAKIQFIKSFSDVEVGSTNDTSRVLQTLSYVVVSGSCSKSGYDHLGGGGAMIPTSIPKFNDLSCLRKTDVGVCACVFQQTGNPNVTVPGSCQFSFKESGNDEVTSN